MVASRKPRPRTKGERRPGETLEQMFQRTLRARVGTRHAFSKAEARYVLRRLWETGDPASSPPGDEVVKRFYGLWPEPADGSYPE